eukprot:GHVP01012155.1.p1 GENE.GHVP01012155.1~~GHVP01012155.1.p1  ORF type:complete len:124 (-),score=14.23 GHVP01012155.1:275-646(-)
MLELPTFAAKVTYTTSPIKDGSVIYVVALNKKKVRFWDGRFLTRKNGNYLFDLIRCTPPITEETRANFMKLLGYAFLKDIRFLCFTSQRSLLSKRKISKFFFAPRLDQKNERRNFGLSCIGRT